MARVYEYSGEDHLKFLKRFEDNPDNASYAVEYAEKLMSNGETDEAIDVLENILSYNVITAWFTCRLVKHIMKI